MELFSTAVGLAICNLASLPFIASVGFMLNEPISLRALTYGAIGGMLVAAFGTILWRMANMISTDLGINVMSYLTPALALGWLFAFSQVGDVSVGYLFFGVVAIIGANIGMGSIETRGQSQESDDAQAREPIDIDALIALAQSAYSAGGGQTRESIDIDALIAGGESETVEFKATFWMDLKSNKNEDWIRQASLKTIAAFLNSDGGTLIIGVADDGSPVGIDKETFLNEDKRKLQISNLVRDRMGKTVMNNVNLRSVEYKGVGVLAVICSRSDRAIFCIENKEECFYIRSGPSNIALKPSEQDEYTSRRFS